MRRWRRCRSIDQPRSGRETRDATTLHCYDDTFPRLSMMRARIAGVLLVSRLSSLVSPLGAQSADLVLRHAKVYTVDAAHPIAQAVAVRGGRIVYVGADAGVTKYIGATTRTLDLAGRFVFPGLADAHGHFPGIGAREMTLNLEGTRTKDEFLARVAAVVRQKKPGEWVTGRGWIETFWVPQGFPTRQ